jgi:hypothetical protein
MINTISQVDIHTQGCQIFIGKNDKMAVKIPTSSIARPSKIFPN